ncbi:MAG: ATP-NAD kinase family protein [Idiomarina sp.]|nr:ATP-NAD kinase family protein [Idiomarina sp.]
MHFKIGLVVNPYAGIGGAVALKGSDGPEVRAEALARGATPKANARVSEAFRALGEAKELIDWVTAGGEMGEFALQKIGAKPLVVYRADAAQTEADDTHAAVRAILAEGVDLLMFAGGDGTARDVAKVLGDNELPVIGIPAGVKIHSGVYAITPKAAGLVLKQLVSGELTTLRRADVMDIDETAFRTGTVRAKRYGELSVPGELEYMQAVKIGGKESDELVLGDIADDVIESMEDDALYIMGSGSTVAAIMGALGLPNTLLGVDLVVNRELLASDVAAHDIERVMQDYERVFLVITLIGGQGHVFGRGNQQLSPTVIRRVGRDNMIVVATKQKLQSLGARPLIADTGDAELDEELTGFIGVTSGYHDKTMVALGATDALEL